MKNTVKFKQDLLKLTEMLEDDLNNFDLNSQQYKDYSEQIRMNKEYIFNNTYK